MTSRAANRAARTTTAHHRIEAQRQHGGDEDRQQRAQRQQRQGDQHADAEQRQERPGADDDLHALGRHAAHDGRAPGVAASSGTGEPVSHFAQVTLPDPAGLAMLGSR
jgi:hypothetical protein